MDLLDEIRLILEMTGMKQYELAELIGCPPATLSRWLNGKSHITHAYRILIENHLEMKRLLKKVRKKK